MKNFIVLTTVLALTLVGSAAMAADLTTDGNINLTAPSPWIVMDGYQETGKLGIQAGFGSAAAGGGITLFGAAHATKSGWVTVGLSSDSPLAKFTVNDQGAAGGTDVFTVLKNGHVGIGTVSPQVSLHNNGDFITKGPWVDARAYNSGVLNDTTITAALTSIGASQKTLLFAPGTWVVSNSITIPSNVNLRFEQGAVLNIAGLQSVTINGPIEAPLSQIFSGTGTVAFGTGSVKEVYPQWWGAKGDWNGSTGTDNLTPLNSTFSSGARVVSIPPGNYYIGSAGGVTIPFNVGVVNGDGLDKTTIFYAGSGSAITENGAPTAVSNLTVSCSDNAAIGISFINACRKASLRNVYVTNSYAGAANTGTAILLDGTGGWIGGIDFDNIQTLGFKYGIRTIGTNGNNTVTALTGKNVWLLGNSAVLIPDSCGIYMDAYTNGVASIITGGTIEFFTKGIKIENGAVPGLGYGISYNGDFEGNTVNWEVGNGFNGEIIDLNGGGYIRQTTNLTANIWTLDTYIPGGVRTTFNRYSQYFDFSNNGDSLKWGAIQGNVEAAGFAFAGSGDTAPERNYIYQRTHKITWSTAAPTAGTWARGDIAYNTTPVAGGYSGWTCVTAGTPGTWKGFGNIAP